MKKAVWLLFLGLLANLPVRADVTVLVHGYLGSDRSWVDSGVIAALQDHGHVLRGTWHPSPQGPVYFPLDKGPGRPLYTVLLPSLAPIVVQADWLAAYLQEIHHRHPRDAITLVGHSAGGVVARMTLVRHRPAGVQRLITIAAPHLGTWRALQALDAVDDDWPPPLQQIRRWEVRRRLGDPLYHTLRASRGVLQDLVPARPGTLLYWLNQQPHPDIEYIALIRGRTLRLPGDRLVPPFSQDMRQVPAIGTRARAYTTPPGHRLGPHDGRVLAALLASPAVRRPVTPITSRTR
ncbi:esterase/lipase family protein [endosymbiont of unidentified scaly snail isolate Monju]|uniref:esterase/lipase family protein n=1 Tax=endosymbiont of unidentified scaly snail isolate Monju TaxID=1248727 RepID=UPI0003891F04|nr:alpha/beta fold hydrolase [endosymbiont of unidentified scaly snail isolate Monju]BAN68576.1 hypothetical protein EBS_0615 [endosymbiont of unidentified scaly snail isolate Monju]